MNDTEFHQLADQLFLGIEETLDAYEGGGELDYEVHADVMTLYFADGSKIVINRQAPLHQIWLASKEGGYHFDYQNNNWYCNRSGNVFYQLLSQACSKQAGALIVFQ